MRDGVLGIYKKIQTIILLAVASTVLVASPALAAVGDVIVTEFMADPDNSVVISDNGGEWIELENTTSSPIDLTGWTLDGAAISPGVIIPAGEVVVICRDSNPANNGGVSCNGTASFQLSNTGDTIELVDAALVMVDEVVYSGTDVSEGQSTNVVRDGSDVITGLVSEAEADYGNDAQLSLQNGSPGVRNATSGAVRNVEDNLYFPSLQAALSADTMNAGETLQLTEDLSTTAQITIDTPAIIDGNGFTITPLFARTGNDNNAVFGIIGTSNVVIQNITIDGSGGVELHGINIYESSNIEINNATITNNRAAIIVNGSSVSAANLTTSGNSWYAVNIDQGSGVTSPAVFTTSGLNSHTESTQIFIDDNSNSDISFFDLDNQYVKRSAGLFDSYLLDSYVAGSPEFEVVTGSTTSTENDPGKWFFNRDSTTASQYEFNDNQASIGTGSLNVLPIGLNPSDKFIGEYFVATPVSQVGSISYDFMFGSGATSSDANEFYMNVYANFGSSDVNKFYDCRYNVVPVLGSAGSFTTVTFDPYASYPVTTRTGAEASPFPCPSSPAGMDIYSPGSVIRVVALNVGDTTASDAGVDGYFDNVVVETAASTKTFDFEPVFVPPCDSAPSSFDIYSNGSVNGQFGWMSTGAFDQEIVSNVYGYGSFGCKALRISNAVTSGSFGDQTFTYSAANEAGEVDATSGSQSSGVRQDRFQATFDIGVTSPNEQPGLFFSVSPDRGDGSRMSYLSFADTPAGLATTFYDTPGTTNPATFSPTSLPTLSRDEPHTIMFDIQFIDGPSNDIVRIYFDGTLVHTGTTWENYYRYDSEASAEQSPRTTDSLLFRASGTAVPANAGNGFLVDNVVIDTFTSDSSAPVLSNINMFVNGVDRDLAKPGDTVRIVADVSDVSGIDRVQIWVRDYPYTGEQITSGDMSFVSGDAYEFEFVLPATYQSGASFQESFEGNYFNFRPYDLVGNSIIGYRNNFTVDQTRPSATFINPNGESYRTTVPVSFEMNDVNGLNNMVVNVYTASNTFIESCGSVNGLAGAVSNTINCTVDVSSYSEGTYTLKGGGYDTAGNNRTISTTFVVDKTRPNFSFVTPADSEVLSGVATVNVESSDDSGIATVAVNIYDESNVFAAPCGSNSSVGGISPATLSCSFNTALYPDGIYTLRGGSFDTAGNNRTVSIAVVVDNTKPTAFISLPVNGSVIQGDFTVSGSVSDATSGIDRVEYTVNEIDAIGGNFVANGPTGLAMYDSLDGTFIYDVNGLVDGFYRVRVQAFDMAENWRHHYVDVVVDNTPPVTGFTPFSTQDTTPALSGTIDDDNVVVMVTVNGLVYSAVVSNGNWTIVDDTITTLAVGSYVIEISAEDEAGNVSIVSFADGLTITAPPAVLGDTTSSPTTGSPQQVGSPSSAVSNGVGGEPFTASLQSAQGTPSQDTESDQAEDNSSSEPQVLQSTTEDESTASEGSNDENGNTCAEILGICWYWFIIPIGGGIGGYLYYVQRKENDK